MRKMLVVTLFLVVGCVWVREASAAPTVAEKCNNQFTKVGMCLTYVTGKADTPTKECCDSVEGIKESDPECLCYVIQQANNGSEQIKKMGIQAAKLLQLPTACSLKNISASDCPKLLGIPPGSPDAAVFNKNASSTATPSTPATPQKAGDSSGITRLGPHHAGLVATVVAIGFFIFPVGSISTLFV